jgi:hypothetical protein
MTSIDSLMEDTMRELKEKANAITENTIKELNAKIDALITKRALYMVICPDTDIIYAKTNDLAEAKEIAERTGKDWKCQMEIYEVMK